MRSLTAGDPREIGPYRLSALLGVGGMGRVYLGTGPDGTPVAVKVVRAEYAYDPGFRGRFARELDLAGRVRGDFTPRVLEADPAGTPPWMATEYVAGPTLHDLVRETGPLPPESGRFLARGVAAALARVHALGTVHRDLKPGNVMVSASGPQVIDFGVARALEEGEDEETAVAGTPGYMAPEQVDGVDATTVTDVFALGGVLVYALTGTGPFGDGHPAAVLFRIAHQEPVLDGVPGDLRDLVAACLSRDPDARPSAERVLAELGGPVEPATEAGAWLPPAAAARVDGIAARTRGDALPGDTARQNTASEDTAWRNGTGPDDTTAVIGTPPNRRPIPMLGAGAAALVLIAGLGAWAMAGRDTPEAEEAPGPASTGASGGATAPGGCDLPGDLAPEYTEAARTDPAVPGADTHHLDVHSHPTPVFLQGGDLLALAHPEGIALWDTETGDEVAYIGADLPDFAQTPVMAPDGCRFGYTSGSGGVHVFDLRTGEHTAHAETLPLPVGVVTFSPDGRSLAFAEGSVGDGAHVIDLATGEATTVFEGAAQGIAHSPDGGLLAVTGGEGSVVVDTRTGAETFRGPEAATASTTDSLALPGDDLFLYIHAEGIARVDLASGEEPSILAPPDDTVAGFAEITAHAGTDRIHALLEDYDEETGEYAPELTVWELSTGERVSSGGERRYVRDIAVHPDGTVIAGLSVDGTSVSLFDSETLDIVAEFG
ncbi:serine/threonine-protein kinase [Nocardiopsis sp. N85]|uniref:serine/threonine-protein kinase n=1 Tax=Nocardiopsis sp. N85 TaxID=3029400 RepID=UPI00237F6EC4|nr:serine/threonine-protein kinase [Nocardiopsis sp. N85]MDE3723061.1 serine/threonine-protein kinase [Nocardiopsis sp. N85]